MSRKRKKINDNLGFGFGIPPSGFNEDLPKGNYKGKATIGEAPPQIGKVEEGSPFDVAVKLVKEGRMKLRAKERERTAKARGKMRVKSIYAQERLRKKKKKKGYVAKELGIRSL